MKADELMFELIVNYFNNGTLRAQFILDFIIRNIEQNLFYLELLLDSHPMPDFQYLTG